MCTLVAPPIRRRQWLGLATAAVVVGAAGLAGCHQQPPLRLGSIVFTGYEPVFMARELGWLDPALVRLVELYSNTDALRALAAGQIEAAQLTVDEFLSGRAEGLDLRIIAVLDESLGADVVIAHPQLHDRQDIRGRRIAVEDGAVGAVMLSAFLNARGVEPSDVVTVPVAWATTWSCSAKGRPTCSSRPNPGPAGSNIWAAFACLTVRPSPNASWT